MTRVELFERIRRDFYVEGCGIRWIARHRHVHRRTVRQALASAVPPPRKVAERAPPKLTRALRVVVDGWLVADRRVPRKQRHTARRIYQRLVAEHGYSGAESTVRGYVGRRRREWGGVGEAFVPQTYLAGEEAEVDWYEAVVDFPAGRTKAQVLLVRASFSGREFHMAGPSATQQAFFEGLAAAFVHFGGVFSRLRFDNLSSAVQKVLRGRRRQETQAFVAFRSHYLFEADFCRPGKAGAHEKGGVEGAVGRFRRQHWVPVPRLADWAALNRSLQAKCAADDQRRITGRARTVGEDWAQEVPKLRALPAEPFPTAEVTTARVDRKSRVMVRTNRYSVPVRLVGRRVEVQLHARRLVVVHGGRIVAEHERLWGRFGERLVLDHYLELLHTKPGALKRARPLHQARAAGAWPTDYDRLWTELTRRYGEAEGARQLVEILFLHREAACQDVHEAVAMALRLGCCDAGAIRVVLRQLTGFEAGAAPLEELGELAAYGEAPADDMQAYDRLLPSRQEEGL